MPALSSGEIVNLLCAHELAIASLYRTFAAVFGGKAAFWNGIARDEHAHADVLQRLEEMLATGKVTWKPSVWKLKELDESLTTIAVQRTNAMNRKLTSHDAVQIALAIENQIIEEDFFTAFESADPAVRQEFDALRDHTQKHIDRLRAQL